jgi:hypothetical protein
MPGGLYHFNRAVKALTEAGIVAPGSGSHGPESASVRLDYAYAPAKWVSWRDGSGWSLAIERDGEREDIPLGEVSHRRMAAAVLPVLLRTVVERGEEERRRFAGQTGRVREVLADAQERDEELLAARDALPSDAREQRRVFERCAREVRQVADALNRALLGEETDRG